MALFLEQTLYNADVVRYHRIGEYKVDVGNPVALAVLESYRTVEQRLLPVAPVIKREYPFEHNGDYEAMPGLAYAAIKALPEWAGATDV